MKNAWLLISKNLYAVLCLFLMMSIAGCVPKAGSIFQVSYLPPMDLEHVDKDDLLPLEGIPVEITAITDGRGNDSIIFVDTNPLRVEGALTILAQDSLRDALKAAQTSRCSDRCFYISGVLKDWSMTVKSDLPLSIAKAHVHLELTVTSSPGYQVAAMPQELIIKASGSSQREHPFLDEQVMSDVYGEAMNEAALGAIEQLAEKFKSS
jgi:hypothetical protein